MDKGNSFLSLAPGSRTLIGESVITGSHLAFTAIVNDLSRCNRNVFAFGLDRLPRLAETDDPRTPSKAEFLRSIWPDPTRVVPFQIQHVHAIDSL